MDADNASLGDERRARREEYGHGQRNSESRGFAGFGANGFEAAEGSNGATNRPESVPDRGYTWTPAPLTDQHQNPQNTGGSAALDPFAAWSTPGAVDDLPGGPAPNPADHDPNSRFTTPPADGPPYSDPTPETAALPTRSPRPGGAHQAPGQADSAAIPRISPGSAPAPALSSSPRNPMPAEYRSEQQHAEEQTVPSGNPPSGPLVQPSEAATTHLPTAERAEDAAGGPPLPPPDDRGARRDDSFDGSAADTGALPSWLSSIGEEPAPQAIESGGRRRRAALTEPAESEAGQFDPFEDPHGSAESGAHSAEHRDTPVPVDSAESLPSGLPTRAPRGQNSAPEDNGSAPSELPARRLPRSAGRHAPADTEDTPHSGDDPTPSDLTTAEPARTPEQLDAPETGTSRELSMPRRLPRSAARYKPDTGDAADLDRESRATLTTGPVVDTESGDHDSATAPESEAPRDSERDAENTPILDRLLAPEPIHGTDPDDDSAGAPVADILTRILESEQEPSGSRHSDASPAAEPAPAEATEPPSAPHRASTATLTAVPDEPHTAPEALTGDDEARPPLESRRSRRAREAAETAQRAPESPAALTTPAPAESHRSSTPADAPSRRSRNEEGADIDIHLIMRLLAASDDLEVLAGQAEAGEVSAAEVARAAREARSAVLSAVTAWYGGPAQMVKFANALLHAARES